MKQQNQLPGSFAQGLRDGFPICLGYLSVSFAFGITVVGAGFPPWMAVLISATNLTSAGQLAGLTVLAAMTIPAIFSSTASTWSAVGGLLAALAVSLMGKGLMPVALSACGVVFVIELFMSIY